MILLKSLIRFRGCVSTVNTEKQTQCKVALLSGATFVSKCMQLETPFGVLSQEVRMIEESDAKNGMQERRVVECFWSADCLTRVLSVVSFHFRIALFQRSDEP